MDLGLKGKRAIVTGGTRGIGRATVELLAAEGASVAFCARNADVVAEVAAELTAKGATVFAKAVDVSKEAELKGFIQEAAAALGGVDIYVSNVTGGSLKGAEQWQQSLELDLLPLVHAIDEVTPLMEAAGGGSIIALSSTFGFDNVWPSSPTIPSTRIVPSVNVPVLSEQSTSMLPKFSIAAKRFTTTRWRAMRRAPWARLTLMIAGSN